MEPTQFGNYTLIERISHGGMAEVYRAKSFGEAGFQREVALKLLLPGMASDAEFVNMLIDEAKIAGQLNHANIAQIFDLGVVDGRYYIVQEYVSGQDLRAILQHKAETKSPLEIATSCHIALKVCEGLYYAHNKQDQSGRPLNLVHRDISPHNVLISNEGEVKIIDFGIAKAEGRATQTMAGLVKGKFAYMSPEQIRGLPVDHRSDVFATGIILHEMLANRSLFRRSSEFETLKRARAATAEAPSIYNPRVPPALDKIVLKALARHVDDRFQSALELRDALWAFAREHNTFSEREVFAQPGAQGAGGRPKVEMELASEVSKLIEITRGDEDSEVGEEDYDIEDEEDVEETDSATMVDPRLPFGYSMSGDEETDEEPQDAGADDDEQWARDIAGPLSSPSPFAMPSLAGNNRKTKQITAEPEEETTSSRGGLKEPPTAPFGKGTPFSLDEATAEKFARVGERQPTVPAMPERAGSANDAPTLDKAEPVLRAPGGKQGEARNNPKIALGVAATQSLPAAALALAPTQNVSVDEIIAPEMAMPPASGAQPTGQGPYSPPPSYPAMHSPAAGYPQPTPDPGYGGYSQPGYASPQGGYAYPRADSGSAPYQMPHSPVPTPKPEIGSKQLYLVMSAVFVLLLAGAATVTLLITG